MPIQVFDKNDPTHLKLAKGLYYYWFTPKDAVAYLRHASNVVADASVITYIFHSFRMSGLDRYDRTNQMAKYMSDSTTATTSSQSTVTETTNGKDANASNAAIDATVTR